MKLSIVFLIFAYTLPSYSKTFICKENATTLADCKTQDPISPLEKKKSKSKSLRYIERMQFKRMFGDV